MMKKTLTTVSIFSLALLAALPAGSDTPLDFDDVVLFATNSIDLNTSADVLSGDVVVNDLANGIPPELGSVELTVGGRVTTMMGDLKAHEILIKKKAEVTGDVFFDLLDNDGTIDGTEFLGSGPPYVTAPVFRQAVVPVGALDIDISDDGSMTLAAGDYGDITVGNDATVIFSGGLYNVRSIDGRGGSRILFDALSDVRIENTFRTANNSVVGPSGAGVSASGIILYVAGENDAGDPQTFPFAAKVGNFSDVDANFYVPNGTLRIKRATNARGAFLAKDVHIEKDVQLTLDSFFLNHSPFVAVSIADVTVDEDAADTVVDLSGTFGDVDIALHGQSLILSVTGNTNPSLVSTSLAGTSLTLDYQDDQNGSATIEITATDTGLPPLSVSDSFLVTVNPVDDPPVAVDDAASVAEDSGATAIDVLGNDTDIDAGPISVSAVTQPAGGVVVNNGTDVSYTPNANFCNDGSPTDDFTYTLAPGGSTATVGITVTCVDDPPVAVDDAASVAEDSGTSAIDVLGNDNDVDGDPFSVDSVTQPSGGVVVNNGSDVSYTPNPDFCNDGSPTDDFTYTLTPGGSTATVRVTVTCVNDAPVANDDTATVDENNSVVVSVLGNDTDIDNANPAELTVSISQGATASGSVSTDGTTITYTPTQNFSGEDRFGYTVCDLEPLCDTAEVVVTVNDLGEPPTATVGIEAVTSGDVNVNITLSGTDPNGDTLTFTLVSGPSAGVLTGLPASDPASVIVTYDPTGAGDVEDSFFFQVDDGNGGTDTAEVLINPGAESQPPPELDDLVAFDQVAQTQKDEGISIVLEGNAPCDATGAPDPDQPCDGVGNDVPLNFLAGTTTAQGGTLTNVVQGSEVPQRSATVEYVPFAGFTGIDSFTFTVEGDVDGTAPLETATATVQISVQNRIPLPAVVAEFQSVATEKDTPVEIDLSGGVGDSGVGGPHGPARSAAFSTVSSFVSSGAGGSDGNGARSGGSRAPVAGDSPTALVAIGVGSGWSATQTVPPAFFWSNYDGVNPVFADDGPFDFTGDACVSVTDDFKQGDQFRVYDNGFPIPIFDSGSTHPPAGETPVVARADGTSAGIGPDAAFVDAGFSSWTFKVFGSSHSITIEIIGLSFEGGRGYIRVDAADSPACNLGQPIYTITSLPDQGGSLTYFGFDPQTFEPADVEITSVPFQLPLAGGLGLSVVTYTPPLGVTGGVFDPVEPAPLTFFSFGVSDGFSSDSAVIDLYVVVATLAAEQCTFNGRDVGCMPGSAPVSAPAPVGGLPSGFAFTVEVSGPGTVSSSRPYLDGKSYLGLVCSSDSDCGANFVDGSTVVLYARPEEAGSEFVEWGGDCYGADPVAVVRAGTDTLCTATFRKSPE